MKNIPIDIIWAESQNGVLGNKGANKLLWRLPKELKHFKEITLGHILIMGRSTLESLPGILPNRLHIIMTRQKDYVSPFGESDMIKISHSPEAAVELAASLASEGQRAIVAGGDDIYRYFMDPGFIYARLLGKLYRSIILAEFQGDISACEINPMYWPLLSKDAPSEIDEKNNLSFISEVYQHSPTII